ncbi:MAG: outer membrane beta-barrel protein [Ferruginibacter sp.]
MKHRLHKLLRRQFVPILFTLTMCNAAQGQHLMFNLGNAEVEAGLNFGPTFFLGDLGGKVGKGTTFIKDLNYQFTKLMKGAFLTVYPNEYWGIRIAAQYTYLEGQDKIISTNGVDELWRKQRNLDFRSNVWEAYGAIEFFPLHFFNRYDEDYDPRFRPYIFGGIGAFHFNPKGSLTDAAGNTTWHDLQPLHTEGQGFAEYPNKRNYSLTKLNLPYGAGFKYILSDKVNVGLELLYRKTFTDYIDDVSTEYIDPNYFDKYLSASDALIARQIHDKTVGIVTPGVNRYEPGTQRGNPRNNDAYFSFLLKLGIRFGDGGYSNDNGYGGGGSGGNARSKMRCPVRF